MKFKHFKANSRNTPVSFSIIAPALLLVPALLAFLFIPEMVSAQQSNVMDYNSLEKFRFARRMFYKGENLFHKGKHKKAEKSFKACLKKFPEYSLAEFYLGRIYYEAGNYPQALKHIEHAKKTYKSFSQLHASTYQEYIDRLRKTKHELQQEINVMKSQLANSVPQAPTAGSSTGGSNNNNNNNSGGVLITRDDVLSSQTSQVLRDKENRLTVIETKLHEPVAKLQETPTEYFYVHANVLFRLKRFKDSFDQYNLTVKRDPKHGNAYSNLANLNFMAKRYKTALDLLDKAEKLGAEPNPKFRAALLEAIKNK
jgi:tetratricopeptide (TPR) repeat protein